MTTVTILSWIATICGLFGLFFLFTELCFFAFVFLFGTVDQWLQDRHFRKLRMRRMRDEKGNDWYVG